MKALKRQIFQYHVRNDYKLATQKKSHNAHKQVTVALLSDAVVEDSRAMTPGHAPTTICCDAIKLCGASSKVGRADNAGHKRILVPSNVCRGA
jgi:hypothetical protein